MNLLKIIVGSSVDERRAILIVVPSTTTTVLPQHIAAEAVLPPSLHGSTIVSRLDSRMQKCALVTITAAAASAAALPPLHRKHFTSSSRLSLTLSSHLVYTYISII